MSYVVNTGTVEFYRGRQNNGRGHAPVDPDPTRYSGRGLEGAADDERRIPVAEAVAVDPHRGRVGGEFPRPHDRDRHLVRQAQASVFDGEPAGRVFQRRQRLLTGFRSGFPATFHRERVSERLGVGAQHLLLRDLRTRPQPSSTPTGLGELLRQLTERESLPGALLVDGFVRRLLLHLPRCVVPEISRAGPRRTYRGAPRPDHAAQDAPIIEPETMPDHVHLRVSCGPQFGIHGLVNQIKGRSSRVLRAGPVRLPTFGLLIRTSSPLSVATLEVAKRYAENQKNV